MTDKLSEVEKLVDEKVKEALRQVELNQGKTTSTMTPIELLEAEKELEFERVIAMNHGRAPSPLQYHTIQQNFRRKCAEKGIDPLEKVPLPQKEQMPDTMKRVRFVDEQKE